MAHARTTIQIGRGPSPRTGRARQTARLLGQARGRVLVPDPQPTRAVPGRGGLSAVLVSQGREPSCSPPRVLPTLSPEQGRTPPRRAREATALLHTPDHRGPAWPPACRRRLRSSVPWATVDAPLRSPSAICPSRTPRSSPCPSAGLPRPSDHTLSDEGQPPFPNQSPGPVAWPGCPLARPDKVRESQLTQKILAAGRHRYSAASFNEACRIRCSLGPMAGPQDTKR